MQKMFVDIVDARDGQGYIVAVCFPYGMIQKSNRFQSSTRRKRSMGSRWRGFYTDVLRPSND
jgi:hypothetical protein